MNINPNEAVLPTDKVGLIMDRYEGDMTKLVLTVDEATELAKQLLRGWGIMSYIRLL